MLADVAVIQAMGVIDTALKKRFRQQSNRSLICDRAVVRRAAVCPALDAQLGVSGRVVTAHENSSGGYRPAVQIRFKPEHPLPLSTQ
ncbi:hypothetical protein FHT15_000621 [Xanthomonas campestris]